MSNALAKLEELGLQIDLQLPYEMDRMFPKLQGWGAKGAIKQKHKTIQKVEPLLKRMILQDERILYVAKGIQVKFSEQYFLGIWANLINQTVFVLTNLRLIMIHVDAGGNPHNMYWVIYYSQITTFKGSWTGQVKLKLQDGLKLVFSGFKGDDRKQMPSIFEECVETYRQQGFAPQVTQSRENLCTNCLAVVPKGQYRCGQCHQNFYTPSSLAGRSLIFPSWGDFTMGHTVLACVELLGYIASWVVLVAIAIAGFNEGGVEGMVATCIFFFFIIIEHVIDSALTFFIAKKGLTPKGEPPQTRPVEAGVITGDSSNPYNPPPS